MKKTVFAGSATALVTPMKEDLSIDFDLFGTLIQEQIRHGTDALVVAGTTGESATLTDEEHIELIRFAVKAAKGRVPVIAGAGSNSTAHALLLTKAAEKAGADALLHVTPYYNKTSQRGLIAHFSACAAATTLPIILYNVPSRTGVNILPETYEKLAQLDNIVATKEASGNFSQMAKIAPSVATVSQSIPATTIRLHRRSHWARRALFQCLQILCRERFTASAKPSSTATPH